MKNKDALQKIAKRGLWNLKILKKMYKNQQHTANIWELAVKGFISSTVDGYGLLYNMGPEFFHFGLYQNKELDKALRNINTA